MWLDYLCVPGPLLFDYYPSQTAVLDGNKLNCVEAVTPVEGQSQYALGI